MKNFLVLFLLFGGFAFAQEQPLKQTQSFTIEGQGVKERVITIDSLNSYPLKPIGDIKITDHTGQFKHEDDQLKGVLVKDLLVNTISTKISPKLYSRYYYAFTGADGYVVVYSWNELFNTEIGNHVYIILEKNGIKLEKLPESIQMTSTMDFKTGRRYLHNLFKIETLVYSLTY